MRATMTGLRHDRSGATSMEFGLIGALVAVAAIAGYSSLGHSNTHLWESSNGCIKSQTPEERLRCKDDLD